MTDPRGLSTCGSWVVFRVFLCLVFRHAWSQEEVPIDPGYRGQSTDNDDPFNHAHMALPVSCA